MVLIGLFCTPKMSGQSDGPGRVRDPGLTPSSPDPSAIEASRWGQEPAMGTEHDARQLISRCVSIVARYHRLEKTWPDSGYVGRERPWPIWGSRGAEIRAVSTEAERSHLPLDRIPPLLLAKLLKRYDR